MSRVFPNPDDVPTSLLVDFHAEHNGDFDYAVLVPYTTAAPEAPPHDDVGAPSNDADRILHVTWRIFASAVHRGAHFLNPLDEAGQPSKGRSIIATLIVADTIVYQTVLVSILRSGAIVSWTFFSIFAFGGPDPLSILPALPHISSQYP